MNDMGVLIDGLARRLNLTPEQTTREMANGNWERWQPSHGMFLNIEAILRELLMRDTPYYLFIQNDRGNGRTIKAPRVVVYVHHFNDFPDDLFDEFCQRVQAHNPWIVEFSVIETAEFPTYDDANMELSMLDHEEIMFQHFANRLATGQVSIQALLQSANAGNTPASLMNQLQQMGWKP